MDFFVFTFYIMGIILIIIKIFPKLFDSITRLINYNYNNNYRYYDKNKFMTNYEKYFYDIFVELEKEYYIRIHPQVNLATIIKKNSDSGKMLELFKNIDFGIFTRNYEELLLLIEINDKTHNIPKRIKRDKKVKEIVNEAGIKLITFYSNYPNSKEYVKNRIIKELNLK